MYKSSLRYFKKKIFKFVGTNLESIINYYNETKTQLAKSSFQDVGNNLHIEYPFHIEGHKNISIGENFRCRHHLRLEALTEYGNQIFNPTISIGDNVTIESNFHAGAINRISIGNGVLIASNVLITDHSHGDFSPEQLTLEPLERKLYSKGEVVIGNNVWIGEDVTILAGVTIGNNVIVGAKSLVNCSFESNCVIAGVPAKVIKLL